MRHFVVFHKGHENLVKDLSHFLHISNCERQCLKGTIKNFSLIIVIGGDGTFLRSSHHNKDIPMFGINPNPSKKEGYYMQATIKDYKKVLPRLVSRSYKVRPLLRLKVTINGKPVKQLALNDVFIGDAKPYNMFNYDLTINNKTEFQRSSGVIIGTPTGSHAWLRSAGGVVMKLDEDRFQYVSRELYERRLTKDFKLKQGIIDNFQLVVRSPAILVVDSISKEYKLRRGDTIKISKGSYLPYVQL